MLLEIHLAKLPTINGWFPEWAKGIRGKQALVKHLSNILLPGARVVAQLVHVRVVLGHDGDGIALLPDDETSLLLRSVPQVDAIILLQEEKRAQYIKGVYFSHIGKEKFMLRADK